jgi:hypothetical protein
MDVLFRCAGWSWCEGIELIWMLGVIILNLLILVWIQKWSGLT